MKVVYKGIAIIKPKIPNKRPEKTITIKTSRGWDFIDDENIYGWSKKLSINWMIAKPEIKRIEFHVNSLKIKASIELVAENIKIKSILISGPKYGIILRIAHKKAIANEFSTLRPNNKIK